MLAFRQLTDINEITEDDSYFNSFYNTGWHRVMNYKGGHKWRGILIVFNSSPVCAQIHIGHFGSSSAPTRLRFRTTTDWISDWEPWIYYPDSY